MTTRIPSLIVALFLIAASVEPVQAQQVTVLVNALENQTIDRNLDWIGEGVAILIADRLHAESRLYVFGRDERLAAYEHIGIPETVALSRATAVKIGWDIGADVVVAGRISGTHEDFRIEVRIIDLDHAASSPEVGVSGKLDDLMAMASSVSRQIASVLAPQSTIPESDYISRAPIPRSAFEAYIRGSLTMDPQRRIELLKDATRLHPPFVSAHYHLGRAYFLNMDYKNSVPPLEKVPVAAVEYPYARFTLGVSYHRLGEYEKAAAVFAALPATYDVLVNLGAALAGKGDAAAAQAAWKRASERDPFGPEAAFNQAYAAFTKGEMDSAAAALDQFLKFHGRDAEALFLLGRAYERLGRNTDAQRVIAQAGRLSSRVERWSSDQAVPNLTRLQVQFNPTEMRLPGTRDVWTAPRLSRRGEGQDVASWLESVRSQIDSQPYGETIRELQDMTRTFPDSPDVSLLLGNVFELQGQLEKAKGEYQKSLQLKPSVDAYLMLARLYRAQNQLPLALQAIDSALKLEPGNAAATNLRTEIERPGVPRGRRRP